MKKEIYNLNIERERQEYIAALKAELNTKGHYVPGFDREQDREIIVEMLVLPVAEAIAGVMKTYPICNRLHIEAAFAQSWSMIPRLVRGDVSVDELLDQHKKLMRGDNIDETK